MKHVELSSKQASRLYAATGRPAGERRDSAEGFGESVRFGLAFILAGVAACSPPPVPDVIDAHDAASDVANDGRADGFDVVVADVPPPMCATIGPSSGDAGVPFAGAVEIAAGARHTCARDAAGATWCWGSNARGQLGDGTNVDHSRPARVAMLDGASAIVTGGLHTCALRMDGTVACWGANDFGQLGDGTTEPRNIPTPVIGITGVAAIAAGESTTCAVGGDSRIRCWGRDAELQFGDGRSALTNPMPVLAGNLADVNGLALGALHGCARVGSTHTLSCWGTNGEGQVGDCTSNDRGAAVQISNDAIEEFSLGRFHSCAIRASDHAVLCWGSNLHRQLGFDGAAAACRDPSFPMNAFGPTVVPMLDAMHVAAGGEHTCAVRADGSVWCFGANRYGQSGLCVGDAVVVPARVPGIDGASAIVAGDAHTCAIVSGGRVMCWGDDEDGRLGDGTNVTRAVPAYVVW